LADDRVSTIKQANDIVDVVGSYLSLRAAGAKFKGLCPFHQDHRPSLDVDPRHQNFRCWSCGKYGDVITFVQEYERVDFLTALELLARRVGMDFQPPSGSAPKSNRALMLEVVAWAADQYYRHLMDSPVAEEARRYLEERGLNAETVHKFGLGFAPASGCWLSDRAALAQISDEMLESLGLIGRRQTGSGCYDRFRNRIMFPIRDIRGQTVGFGGRILPGSSSVTEGVPKYYNSCATQLFNKSELLYGLDQARPAASQEGYLAVVEGYTDVLMAHQLGVRHVVATLGTALNGRHVQQLRRFVPKVVLVFDADVGGSTGVDRALEIFLSQDVDLAIASLPEGSDPCDLLNQQGPEAFRQVLKSAINALEFKIARVLAEEQIETIEGQRRAIESLLRIIALTLEHQGEALTIKRQLVVTRIAKRFGVTEKSLWRQIEVSRNKLPVADHAGGPKEEEAKTASTAKASTDEKELLQLLLAHPRLLSEAAKEITLEQIAHPGLRTLLAGLHELQSEGKEPGLDLLRGRISNPALADYALRMQEIGRTNSDPEGWLDRLILAFRRKNKIRPKETELKVRLRTANDHASAIGLLRQLQNPN
jgi:DNA primase